MNDDELSFDSGMEVSQERTLESTYRRGASQAARWLASVAKQMAQESRGAGEIAAHLDVLTAVLRDWRSDSRQERLPSYPPWEWDGQKLNDAIESHRQE